MENLDELRKEVDSIDESIIGLISKRFAITKEIGNLKKAESLETYDPVREEKIASRWKDIGENYGLNGKMLAQILESILRFSRYKQADKRDRRSIVILGTGNMAEALGMLARNSGHAVYVAGRNMDKARRLSELIGADLLPKNKVKADYIVLCVPPEALEAGLLKLVSNCECDALMDISSSKAEHMKNAVKLASDAGMRIISTHPLFGIEDAEIGAKIAIITDNITNKEADDAAGFWSSIGLLPIKMGMDEHERAMSVSQVLRHAYALGFYDSVVELSGKLNVDYKKACTAKFAQMLENAKSIKSEEWVAAEVARSNPYSRMAYEIAERRLNEHASATLLNLKG